MFEFGRTQQPFKTSAVTPGALAIDQQTEAILEGELVARLQLALFFERTLSFYSLKRHRFAARLNSGVRLRVAHCATLR